jgi:predicted O-methyltransferase YrrM
MELPDHLMQLLDAKTPYLVRRLIRALRYPPGSYYSPLPSLREVRRREAEIFGAASKARTLAGIDLNEPEQLALLDQLAAYYPEQPFPEKKEPHRRYFFANDYFSYSDALFLYAMIRHARPARIIEVGSGYSSCVMMDTNELFFGGRIACCFIDPDLRRLRTLLTRADLARIDGVEKPVQEINLRHFAALSAGDILFIDSSHVAKVGSDLNRILFEVLPVLPSGVLVHFHDVFWPFEYPKSWVYQGRAFNEVYLLRAFLQYNCAFKVILFTSYLEAFYRERLEAAMSLCLRRAGRSLWLQKV